MNAGPHLIPAVVILATVGAVAWEESITAPVDYGNVVHVSYWEKWTGFERDAMKAVVDRYNQTEGAKKHIFVDFMPVNDISDKTIVAISGALPPDLAGLSTVMLPTFADNHAIMPLDGFCKQYGIKEGDYVPIYWQQMYYGGHVYALPSTPDSCALHYNRAEFRAAGLDPNRPPQTLDELDRMSEKLTKKDSTGTYTHFGFIPTDPGGWTWGWGYFFGAKLWNGKDTITCNSPENIEGFTWASKYAQRYGATTLNNFKSSFVYDSPTNGFVSGKEAMQLEGVWMYNFVNHFNPSLDWAAAPFPHPKDRPDLANMTFADSDDLAIPIGAKHPREAFDFIAFVQRQENMELLCMGQRKQSPLAKVSSWFMKNHPNPYIALFTDLPKLKTARIPPMMGIFNEYNDALGEAFDEMNLGTKTPTEALDDVQVRMQKKLDHYLKIKKLREEAGA